GRLDPGLPAAKAGLKEDDKIVALNGQPVPSIESIIDSLQQTKEQPVIVSAQRGGQTLNFTMQPVLSQTEDPKEQRYRLGFTNKGETKVSKLPLPAAFALSLEQNKKYSLLILELAKKMVQRKISLRA